MKRLVSILAIGLVLNSFPHLVKGVENTEETFSKLCGRLFVITVLSICRQFDREYFFPEKPPNVKRSDNEDPSVAKSKRMYDNDGMQWLVLPYTRQPFKSDQNGKAPGNLNFQYPEAEVGNIDVRKFNKTEISEQCCQSTCNVRQLRRLCFW